jgi:hypothetical protein
MNELEKDIEGIIKANIAPTGNCNIRQWCDMGGNIDVTKVVKSIVAIPTIASAQAEIERLRAIIKEDHNNLLGGYCLCKICNDKP